MAKGRKDNEGQEKVIEIEPVRKALKNLLALKEKQKNAAKDFSDAVKSVAEKSGFNAKNLRAYVNAKYAETIDTGSRDAQQLSLLFEELEDTAGAGRANTTEQTDNKTKGGNGAGVAQTSAPATIQ